MDKKKIIVIKIGSSVIITRQNKLDELRISHIGDQILTLREKGFGVILVVSGAVACGFITHTSDRSHMLLKTNFSLLRQAIAGIGQVQLITVLNNIFKQKQITIAQILLNKDDLWVAKKRKMIKIMLKSYVQSGIIPILNENDVVVLNSFGGNDFLAAEIAKLMEASQLLILSSYQRSKYGIGGGKSKKEVVRILSARDIETVIIDGKIKNIILTNIKC